MVNTLRRVVIGSSIVYIAKATVTTKIAATNLQIPKIRVCRSVSHSVSVCCGGA